MFQFFVVAICHSTNSAATDIALLQKQVKTDISQMELLTLGHPAPAPKNLKGLKVLFFHKNEGQTGTKT